MVTAHDFRPALSNHTRRKIDSYNDGEMNFIKNKHFLENKDKKKK